jgi:hypothetical protein
LDGRDISNVVFCDFYILPTTTGPGYAKRISRNAVQEDELLDEFLVVAKACNAGLDDGILTRCHNPLLPGSGTGRTPRFQGFRTTSLIKEVWGPWGVRNMRLGPTLSEEGGIPR